MRSLAPLVAILAFATPVSAQEGREWLDVSAHLIVEGAAEAGEVGVGEPFRLVIEARHSPGGVALLPEKLELGGGLAERVQSRAHARTVGADAEIDRYELELLAFEPGALNIPSIPLALGSTTASTPALELTVRTGFSEEELPIATSTLAEAAPELEQMAAPNPPPGAVLIPDFSLLWAGGALLLGLALALLAVRLLRRGREEAARGPPPPPPRPAHEVALEGLEALAKAGHLEAGRTKRFYVELSAILRAWAGGRWGFESVELTLEELLEALRARDTRGLDLARLEQVLGLADLVKFAKLDPSRGQGEEALTSAVELVEATRPQPATQPAAQPGAAGPAEEARP